MCDVKNIKLFLKNLNNLLLISYFNAECEDLQIHRSRNILVLSKDEIAKDSFF